MNDKNKLYSKIVSKRQNDRWEKYFCIADFKDGIYECDHVSPYSLSASNLDAEIMIILQDWSSSDRLGGPIDEYAIKLGHTPTLKTNIYLKDLLLEHFDVKLQDTFATNLFPFIKEGALNARIRTRDLLRAAIEYALPQKNVVNPKLAICFGKETFNALRRATGLKPCKNIAAAIESSFTFENTKFWCQSHPGQLGRNNRNRGGIDRVTNDWARMKSDYER